MLDVIAIVVCLVWLMTLILPAYKDITNNQFVEVSAKYTRTGGDDWFSNGKCSIEVNGVVTQLELPDDWTEEEFPVGEFDGVVWYSQESKIILKFERDSGGSD